MNSSPAIIGLRPSPHFYFRTIISIGAAFCLIGSSFALDPTKAITQYGQAVWKIDNGLPQNSVNAIVQTRDGYLWVGTYEGLARFDGVKFTVINKRTSPALKNLAVRTLAEDAAGNLWVGTEEGLSRLNKDGITTFGPESGLPSGTVRALLPQPQGSIWIGTENGLAQFQSQSKRLVPRAHSYFSNFTNVPVDASTSTRNFASFPEGP